MFINFAFLHEETDRLGDRPNSSDGRTLLRGVSPPELVAFCPCTPENLFNTLTLERRRNTKTNAPPTPFCATKWAEWKQELSLWLTPKRRHNHLTAAAKRAGDGVFLLGSPSAPKDVLTISQPHQPACTSLPLHAWHFGSKLRWRFLHVQMPQQSLQLCTRKNLHLTLSTELTSEHWTH